MTDGQLSLDSFLPYRLSVASNLVSEVISQAYASLFALSIPEWRLIAVIAEGEALSQQEVCGRTRMDKVTVSRAAIALQRRGMIVRSAHPHDGRSHILSLSEQGRTLYRHVAPLARELESRIFGGLSREETRQLTDLLGRIETAAAALLGSGDTRGRAG